MKWMLTENSDNTSPVTKQSVVHVISCLLVDDGYAEIVCLVVKLELGAVDGSVILIERDVRLLGSVEHNDTVGVGGLNANDVAVLDRKREDAGTCRRIAVASLERGEYAVVFKLVGNDHSVRAEGIAERMTEGMAVVVIVTAVTAYSDASAKELVIKDLIVFKAADQVGIRVIELKALPPLELKYVLVLLHRPDGMVVGYHVTVLVRGLDKHIYVLCGVLAGILRADAVELCVIVLEILAVDAVVADVFVVILIARKKIEVHLGQIAVALRLLVGTDISLVARQHKELIVCHIVVRMGGAMVGDRKHGVSLRLVSRLELLGSQTSVRDSAVAMHICLELLFVFGYKYFNSHNFDLPVFIVIIIIDYVQYVNRNRHRTHW